MLTKEDLQAIGELMDAKLEPVKTDIARLEVKADKGFDRLECLINVAAKDASRTERLLREHMEQPIH